MLQQRSFSMRYENIARTSALKGRERITDTYGPCTFASTHACTILIDDGHIYSKSYSPKYYEEDHSCKPANDEGSTNHCYLHLTLPHRTRHSAGFINGLGLNGPNKSCHNIHIILPLSVRP